MRHKLKALAGLVFAILVLSVPAAAQAANFTASSYPATITGVSGLGNGELKTEAGGTECREHFQGSMSEPEESLTTTWSLSECRWFGFLSWQVNMNGCDLQFALTGGSGDSYSAATSIVCPAGKSIEITVSTCAFHYPPQTGSGSVDFTNDTAGGDITMQATVSGLKYVVTKDGFGCPFGGTGEKSGGTYTHNNPVTLDAIPTLDIG